MERYDYQQQQSEQEQQMREAAQFAQDIADDNELLAQWAELNRKVM